MLMGMGMGAGGWRERTGYGGKDDGEEGEQDVRVAAHVCAVKGIMSQ